MISHARISGRCGKGGWLLGKNCGGKKKEPWCRAWAVWKRKEYRFKTPSSRPWAKDERRKNQGRETGSKKEKARIAVNKLGQVGAGGPRGFLRFRQGHRPGEV